MFKSFNIVTALILWCVYTIIYGVISNNESTLPISGYLSLFAEMGLDTACAILAYKTIRNLENPEKIIFKLIFVSFILAILSDGSYNIILNIFGIVSFSVMVETIFDLPFTGFLLLQTISWALIFKVTYSENALKLKKLILLPFLLSGAVILLTFFFLPSWKVSPLSIEGIYNITDTFLEVASFGFVVISLFSAKNKNLALLASGYLIIIASDFIIRFAEIEKVLFPGSALETTWVLGLILFFAGLYKIKNLDNFTIKDSLNRWNSLHVQIGYWLFTSSLFSIFILLVLNYVFSNLDLKGIRDIPATLIVFAVVSSIISHVISSYLIKPFGQLNKIVKSYANQDTLTERNINNRSQIEEFIELEGCLYEGLLAIKNRSLIEKSYFKSVLNYTNKIRNPVSAISMLAEDINELPEEKRSLLINAAREINESSKELIEKINQLPKEDEVNSTNNLESTENIPQVIMVDDNVNLSMAWEMDAENNDIKLTTYNHPSDFINNIGNFSSDVNIYIDVNLSEEMNGVELSEWAHKKGFKNLYLITGEDPKQFETITWIKAVYGKNPPFSH
jgi:hypothetical protein